MRWRYSCDVLALENTSAGQLLRGLDICMPRPFASTSLDASISGAADFVTLSLERGHASSNKRATRHILATVTSLPANVMALDHRCAAHQCHRALIPVLDSLGCLVPLMSYANLLAIDHNAELLASAMSATIESASSYDCTFPACSDQRRTNESIIRTLLRTDDAFAWHWDREGRLRPTAWHADVRALVDMLNCDWSGPLQHRCVREDGQRCCKNRDECVTKLTTAAIRVFLGRRLPVPSLGRWTHARQCFVFVLIGFVCHFLLRDAVCQGWASQLKQLPEPSEKDDETANHHGIKPDPVSQDNAFL